MILITIRRIQIKKESQDIGAGILLFLGILWVLIYGAYQAYQQMPNAAYVIAALFLACLNIQFTRKDKSFVYNCIEKPYREIYVEYVLLTLPFSITALFTPHWFLYPILLIALMLVPFFKYSIKQKTYFSNLSRYVSPRDYELISIFRRTFLYIIPAYILALALSWFRFFPLILVWFIVITIASGYNECESLNILREGAPSPVDFLKQKFVRHSKYLLLIMVPVIVVNTICNPELWLLNLLFIPTQLAVLAAAIFLKYSNYEPNRFFIGNNLIFAFVSLAAIVPFLLPVPLLAAIVFFNKSKHHLQNYL